MPQITSTKQQKKKDRVNVYLDGKFGFGIDLDNFVILNLKIGQELTKSEIDKILKKAEFQKTLEKLLNFATVRPRSEKEIKNWLYRKKVSESLHSKLLSRLIHFNLLDDEKFAEWWLENRKNFSPKPKRMLKEELKLKGIDKNIVDKILVETNINEEKIARNLLEKRKLHWENIEKAKRNQKMLEYLVRKGFAFEIAKLALKDYNNI